MFWRTTIICVVYSDLKKRISQKLVFGEKRWNKKSLGAKSALDPSIRRFGRSQRRWLSRCSGTRIVMLNNDSSSLVRFSNCSEDFKQTNCGVTLGIDRPTMVKWNSRHMTSFAEETGDHLLRSYFSANNFRWIWLGLAHKVDCWIRTDPWFFICEDLINVLSGPPSYFCNFSLHKSINERFWVPTRISLLFGQLFMQHWMYAGGKSAQGRLYLTACHITFCWQCNL